jgi:hypothetical protein
MLLHQRLGTLLALITALALAAACGGRAYYSQLLEARRLASEMHVAFASAAAASSRAVMADTDEASAGAVEEARRDRVIVERNLQILEPMLEALGFRDDLSILRSFKARYEEYRRIDEEVLPLAVENTNLKAQRLAFGAGREAAGAFRASLEAAVRGSRGGGACCLEASAVRAGAAVLEIQVLQAPHIAEADEAVMTRLEEQMTAAETAARRAVGELRASVTGRGRDLDAAVQHLDRFMAVNKEILGLSRRNSEVRSLALSLGRKRTVTAAGQDDLRALEEALAKHEFSATR